MTLLFGFDVLGSVRVNESSRHGFDDDDEEDEGEDDILVVWEDSMLSEGVRELVCLENDNTPLDITPLAMSKPLEKEIFGGELLEKVASEEAPLSEWVLDKLQRFREYLGASYEGYEMEIMDLLMAIDARYQQYCS
uniref:Uncharacterized protein n=1 Tax=Fagus sylvatica TaxID=28930 RepID=A0A2N9FL52_FAGSY